MLIISKASDMQERRHKTTKLQLQARTANLRGCNRFHLAMRNRIRSQGLKTGIFKSDTSSEQHWLLMDMCLQGMLERRLTAF